MCAFREPEIIAELRDGGRLAVSVTELKKYMSWIIDFINTYDRELYITRQGVLIGRLLPYRESDE